MELVAPGLVIEKGLRYREHIHDYDVEVEIGAHNGRLVARELRVRQIAGGPPVTVEGIRALPVARLVRLAGSDLQRADTDGSDSSAWLDTANKPSKAEAKQMVADGPTDRTLQLVAYLYRWSNAVGDPPVKTLENYLELSRSKTSRWITLARERGFLGPADGQGRAGG